MAFSDLNNLYMMILFLDVDILSHFVHPFSCVQRGVGWAANQPAPSSTNIMWARAAHTGS